MALLDETAKGVYVIAVTPFTETGALDHLRQGIEHGDAARRRVDAFEILDRIAAAGLDKEVVDGNHPWLCFLRGCRCASKSPSARTSRSICSRVL